MQKKKDSLNRQHKDTIFTHIFKEPKNFLHLLRACQTRPAELSESDILPFDLDSVAAIRKRRNDVSFITKDNRLIILVEHQSTINPNMAIRLLLYYFELVQLWLELCRINLFSSKPIADIPLPELYVAYNGTRELKDYSTQVEIANEFVNIAVKVRFVDIRFDNLESAHDTDNVLAGYSFLLKEFGIFLGKRKSRDEAFEEARKSCINAGYLKGIIDKEDFIMNYKSFLDYDVQVRTEAMEEGIEIGFERGIERGIERGANELAALIKNGMSVDEALSFLRTETKTMRLAH